PRRRLQLADHLVELLGVDTGVAVVLLDHLEARAGLAADEEGLRSGGEQRRDVGVATVVERARSDPERTKGRKPLPPQDARKTLDFMSAASSKSCYRSCYRSGLEAFLSEAPYLRQPRPPTSRSTALESRRGSPAHARAADLSDRGD